MHFYTIERMMDSLGSVLFGAAGLTGPVMGIIGYVLSALALYTMAENRGIRNGWMAWLPVLNVWIIGSLSDQYRYVVKGEIRAKRKALLILKIVMLVLWVAFFILSSVLLVGFFGSGPHHPARPQMLQSLVEPGLILLGVSVALMGLWIATTVIRYMALYDIFQSSDPQNGVLFLVLSIVIGVTQPVFLFICRNKELGMPPRAPRPEKIVE